MKRIGPSKVSRLLKGKVAGPQVESREIQTVTDSNSKQTSGNGIPKLM